MSQALFDKIESEQFRKNPLQFNVGDNVRVHTKVVEGDKERIQVFAGIVIGRRGRGLNEHFTVRRAHSRRNISACPNYLPHPSAETRAARSPDPSVA